MALFFGYDPLKPRGSRLPSYIRDEIAALAPANVGDGDITEPKLADEAVSTRTIALRAVTGTRIANGAVDTPQLAFGAVDTNRLEAGAVTVDKCSDGITITTDLNGSPVEAKRVKMSQSTFNGIDRDPNTTYYLTAG